MDGVCGSGRHTVVVMKTITMEDRDIGTVEQLKAFLKLDTEFQFVVESKKKKYAWMEDCLRKFGYHSLKKKKERTIVRRYIRKVTGFSKPQLTRLIGKHKACGKLFPDYSKNKKLGFKRKYGADDIALLIATDIAHEHLSGEATKKILERTFRVFGDTKYKTIAGISVSHLYTIRKHNRQYNSSGAKYLAHTRATSVDIGVRAKPEPCGKPGYLRVDTVHSGDLGKVKGVYHINIVDEVTQFEMIATIEGISELFLFPVMKELLSLFPFRIHEFHSDNGSEFINKVVAQLLTKLYVRQTKSRARHSNDNALVESKNGSIIRKLFGHNHIPTHLAPHINDFDRLYVNRYLNYHRPCGFAEDYVDARGKAKKRYREWMTPYEKLRSLPQAETHLREGVTFETLDDIAFAQSDNDCAQELQTAKIELFTKLRKLAH